MKTCAPLSKFAFVLAFVTSTMFVESAPAAIFGIDNRTPITEGSRQANVARSTAIAVLSANHEPAGPGLISLNVDPMPGSLCPDEKFATDPSLSYSCSGFLVGPDLIATAGHCMVNVGESQHETDTYCEAYSWLFDYQNTTSAPANTTAIPEEKLYRCKEVIYAIREEEAPFRDFALVRLDREVKGCTPLKLATAPIGRFEDVSMIGYPFGSPVKYSPLGKVLLNNVDRQSFITSLDAFEGNSGSAVFNQRGEVAGILVGGAPTSAFVKDEAKGCYRYNHCDDQGKNCQVNDQDTSVFPGFQSNGSEVQRIAPLADLIRKLVP